jgi:peptide/nickel transport system substrate-binding protein
MRSRSSTTTRSSCTCRPDIAVIVNMTDYPAAVVHPDFTGDDPVANPIGTGPYRPVSHETGIGA